MAVPFPVSIAAKVLEYCYAIVSLTNERISRYRVNSSMSIVMISKKFSPVF